MLEKMWSPSRTYVILIKGVLKETPEFKKFVLPEECDRNDSEFASWYYLNRLDLSSMAYPVCMPFEIYSNISTMELT